MSLHGKVSKVFDVQYNLDVQWVRNPVLFSTLTCGVSCLVVQPLLDNGTQTWGPPGCLYTRPLPPLLFFSRQPSGISMYYTGICSDPHPYLAQIGVCGGHTACNCLAPPCIQCPWQSIYGKLDPNPSHGVRAVYGRSGVVTLLL